jgi:sugar (pentulose or hexulose) kinase
LQEQFYKKYGGEENFSLVTASPVLGSLNSGMQLYRFKQEQPALFAQMKFALHLPQYISWLVTKQFCCELTSIGCHTGMWNFEKQSYHSWIAQEGIAGKLPPLLPSDKAVEIKWEDHHFISGIGLHDSSAALIPYLANFSEPFVLISTGTWCISLNPFNDLPLTAEELKKDCLCYLTYKGKPVKASRLFAGNEHEQQVKRLADHFNKPLNYYKEVKFNQAIHLSATQESVSAAAFGEIDLSVFDDYSKAYQYLMVSIVKQQVASTELVLKGTDIKRIFVDGGFSKNPFYMILLARALPGVEVYAASMAQATALGAALAVHSAWNNEPIRKDLIELNFYSGQKEILNY